jgi:hypothetical protein
MQRCTRTSESSPSPAPLARTPSPPLARCERATAAPAHSTGCCHSVCFWRSYSGCPCLFADGHLGLAPQSLPPCCRPTGACVVCASDVSDEQRELGLHHGGQALCMDGVRTVGAENYWLCAYSLLFSSVENSLTVLAFDSCSSCTSALYIHSCSSDSCSVAVRRTPGISITERWGRAAMEHRVT